MSFAYEHSSADEVGASLAPCRVAFQGELGAFSEEAAHACFGIADVATIPCRDFAGVARAVIEGDSDYGMLPVENSIAGGVAAAYDVLPLRELSVVGEVVHPIRLCLLGVSGAEPDRLRRVLSHPVALAQCQKFLATLAADAIAVHDTAGAARMIAETRADDTAAVAGRGAAGRYGLTILRDRIEDRSDNQTRFFVLARRGTEPLRATHPDARRRTALLLETAHRAGALVDALLPFAQHGINLTRIESRPAHEPWQYRFFLEFDADAAEARAARAIAEIRERAHTVQVLGCFSRLNGDVGPLKGESSFDEQSSLST